jgi:hypothetical protein
LKPALSWREQFGALTGNRRTIVHLANIPGRGVPAAAAAAIAQLLCGAQQLSDCKFWVRATLTWIACITLQASVIEYIFPSLWLGMKLEWRKPTPPTPSKTIVRLATARLGPPQNAPVCLRARER